MHKFARALALFAVGAMVVIPATQASAHESREVGDYEFVVGWYDEPAFANAKNGPELFVTDSKGDPVNEGVELSVDISFEEETMTAELEPAFVVGVFGEEGNYNADIYPTRAGTYSFRLYGTVEGNDVDETFTSGPDTFGDIEDPNEVAFPVQDPAISELADEVDQLAAAEPAAPAESDDSATTLAYVGIAIGAIGLIVAIAALRRKRTA